MNNPREALKTIRDKILVGGFGNTSPAEIVNICDASLSQPQSDWNEEEFKKCRALKK